MGMKAWTPMRARAWLEGIQYRGMQLGMERVRSMAARLGNPEISFPSILIAGTNGKGSVAAILDSILTAAGLRTGRYTSPHLSGRRISHVPSRQSPARPNGSRRHLSRP